MISIRKKTKVISDLFDLFTKKGKVLTYEEYTELREVPTRMATINDKFGTYGKMINTLRLKHAAEWEKLHKSFEKPNVAPKKVEEKAKPKPKPVEKKKDE